jgi:importin-5
MLLQCAKDTNQLTQEIFSAVFQELITIMSTEPDPSFLASLYKSFYDSARVVGASNIPSNFVDAMTKASQSQLQTMAHRRKSRANIGARRLEEEQEDIALVEEMEHFALEDMAKAIELFDKSSPLLIAISSVKELAVIRSGSDGWESDG